MNTKQTNPCFSRLALALAAAIALTLPVNSAATDGQATHNMTIDGGMMSPTTIATHNLRLDGVAASLVTRPVATLTSVERRHLADRYSDRVIAASTDLEAFARCAEFAAYLADGDMEEFVMTLSYLTLDATDNWTAIAAGPLTRVRQRIHNVIPFFPTSEALLRYGSQGFAVDDKSNQPQHFWYSVAIAYKWGDGVAELIARYHEWNPPVLLHWPPGTGNGRGSEGDFRLSRQGMALGKMLRHGTIPPESVGDWMREHLG
jgi:hypothetical protein